MPYLDHAGAAIPSKQQLKDIANLNLEIILANPHSHHASALRTRQIVDSARLRVLNYLSASPDEYFVIFTNNTSHSLKIVAENFYFTKTGNKDVSEISNKLLENKSQFAYLYDAHHSVVGLRNILLKKLDSIACVSEDDLNFNNIPTTSNSLFILTLMSNFCGKKYSLNYIDMLQSKGWSVCLDAASFLSSSPLDLSKFKPDFVAFSFYKLFGYPTGIGALVVKKDSVKTIPKCSFAGGTVQSVEENNLFFISREGEDGYEEGTLNYYGIAQLQMGFAEIERYGGLQSIQKKTYKLAELAYKMLRNKKHQNGNPIVEVYSQSEEFSLMEKQGPIISFNLKRPDGGYFGYNEVEKLCAIFGIELRTGCFCNIGACKKYLNLSSETIQQNRDKGKRCGDEIDIINGRPTGAIRISFGRQSTEKDIDAIEQLIDTCFTGSLNNSIHEINCDVNISDYNPFISHLFAFPIKSCCGQNQQKFQLNQRGFKYDREFMIVQNDMTLTLKTHRELIRLSTTIVENTLNISIVDENENIGIPLNIPLDQNSDKMVCKNRVPTMDCGDKVANWLNEALNLSNLRLLRVSQDSNRSFVNDSPILLINEASIHVLSQIINIPIDAIILRFRANLVIRGLPPFIEDTAKNVTINGMEFEVTDKCTRCEMICIDPDTGIKDPSLLKALRTFREKQKITFGIYIKQKNYMDGDVLSVGDALHFV